jgi:hypothetical protein
LVGGKGGQRWVGRYVLTIEFLEDALDSAGAAGAGHGDCEFVGVGGEGGGCGFHFAC